MAGDLLALMWVPFLMCLVLTGIHAYLGLHVIAREVVFVDIALAQIAALGAAAAILVGFDVDSHVSYFFALGATVLGALVLAFTRSRERRVSQEAVIGVVYAVSAGAAVLLMDRAPHGAEHLRGMLVGNILTASGRHVAEVAALYGAIGLLHWCCRRPFFLISTDPERAFREGWQVRRWDFLFYATFGVVVTSSVRVAGVLLVFSYLIVPALAAMAVGGSVTQRLVIGWGFGTLVSVLGMLASALLDLPTGATVVCAFGVTLILWWAWRRVRAGGKRGLQAWLHAVLTLATVTMPLGAFIAAASPQSGGVADREWPAREDREGRAVGPGPSMPMSPEWTPGGAGRPRARSGGPRPGPDAEWPRDGWTMEGSPFVGPDGRTCWPHGDHFHCR
jgi:zinc/manganese transport system permease protein